MSSHPTNRDELVEELADFWLPELQASNWEQRLRIIHDVQKDLSEDRETRRISTRFVAALIERLGTPPIETAAQATFYALSSQQAHRDEARFWNLQNHPSGVVPPLERRRYPRKIVNLVTSIWFHGLALSCRLIDISIGGARVAIRSSEAPPPGTKVRLIVPHKGICDAIVVITNEKMEIGLSFLEQPQAAPA